MRKQLEFVHKQSKYGVKKDTYEKPSGIIDRVTDLDKMIKKYRDQSAIAPQLYYSTERKSRFMRDK